MNMDINDITIEDIRELRPDLYQEIVKEATRIPQVVTDDDVEEIIKPLFDEFEEETEKRVGILEKKLHLIVKNGMKDILSTLLDKYDKEKNKIQPRRSKKIKVETIQRKALIGDYIIWRPTEEMGKVVRFEIDGNLRKIVLKLRSKEYIKVYDNWKMYDVVIDNKE